MSEPVWFLEEWIVDPCWSTGDWERVPWEFKSREEALSQFRRWLALPGLFGPCRFRLRGKRFRLVKLQILEIEENLK